MLISVVYLESRSSTFFFILLTEEFVIAHCEDWFCCKKVEIYSQCYERMKIVIGSVAFQIGIFWFAHLKT